MRSVLRMSLLLLPVILIAPANRALGPGRMAHLPLLTLWAWQMPERLDFIDPAQVGVAYLDQTLLVREDVVAQPRVQPLLVAPGTRVMAVVRIEMPASHSSQSEEIKSQVVAALLRSARRPGIDALQVDFDAVKSQRRFYRDVLVRLREQMPRGMPLSITALASWCAYDNWIAGLPIDEAVPMLFRMGQERSLFEWKGPAEAIREPLCSGSLGVSMDEPWPPEIGRRRLYVFHTRPWTRESVTEIFERSKQ